MIQMKLLRAKKDNKDLKLASIFVGPVVIYLLVVMLFPLLWAVYTSFTNKTIGTSGTFIGISNFIELIKDSLFLKAVVNTLIFTLSAVIIKIVFGMIMALVLNENIRFRNLFRALLFLPWTIPTLVSVFTWQWMFSDVGGVLNFLLMGIGIAKQPIGWLSTPSMAMFSVVLINVWRGIPFLGISILAGLQTIPLGLYEAATIDGANVINRFRYITLPCVKDLMLLASLVTTIWTLNDFEIIWLLTRGGPSNGTQVISTLSYTIGFLNQDLGKAIAISLLSLPPMIYLVHIITKMTSSSES